MALPVILFNNSTGSDTAASGAGPGTALSGANAATVAANNVVTLSVDAPNLSGVATDGSAVMWVSSSTGRQYSKITATDNTLKTVTCEDNYANTEGTRGWGIGGKRKTIGVASGARLFTTDIKPSWIAELEDNQSISATLGTFLNNVTTDWFTLRGKSGSTPLITETGNAVIATISGGWRVQNLQFVNSNAAHPRAWSAASSGLSVFERCVFGDGTNTIASAIDRTANNPRVLFIDCEIKNCTGFGILLASTGVSLETDGCWIHDNLGGGISCGASVLIVRNTLIETNTGDGINLGTTVIHAHISDSTIDGNTGDGIDGTSAVLATQAIDLKGCNITANGGYGVNPSSGINLGYEDYNNFGTGATANTSGALNGLTQGAHSLSVDPAYTNSAANNYGVGAAVQGKGFPDANRNIGDNNSATVSTKDIGCAQHLASGSAGMLFIPNLEGT